MKKLLKATLNIFFDEIGHVRFTKKAQRVFNNRPVGKRVMQAIMQNRDSINNGELITVEYGGEVITISSSLQTKHD